MKKFDKKYKMIMESIKLINKRKSLIKEHYEQELNNDIMEEIEKALDLIKIDVSPAVSKLQELGYINGSKKEDLQQYVDETFSYVDYDDVLMNFKLALIVEALKLNINDTALNDQ